MIGIQFKIFKHALISFFFIAQLLSAQVFTEIPQTPPLKGGFGSCVAFADVDGDNDQDILVMGTDDSRTLISKLYINDGVGNFTEKTGTSIEGIADGCVAFADVDGDNDQDLFITGRNSSFARIAKLYMNDGMGNFTEKTGTSFEGVQFGYNAFADVDGDNDQDILIAGLNGSDNQISKLYINDGIGNFTEKMGTPFYGVQWSYIAFADVDGDNDQDVFITGVGQYVPARISTLYINDGMGNFTEKTGTPFDGLDSGLVALADVDGDNDLDVLLTGVNNSEIYIAKLYLNDGMGNFTEKIETPFVTASGSFVDVDRDGDSDVLMTGLVDFDNNRTSKLYINDGKGDFTEKMETLFERDSTIQGSLAFADVDGDDEQEVLIVGLNSSLTPISRLYNMDCLVSSVESVSERLNFEFLVYPNPSGSDKINISHSSTKNELLTINVFDLKGKLLIEQREWSGIGEQAFSVDITSLTKGIHFIELDDGKRKSARQFLVQ